MSSINLRDLKTQAAYIDNEINAIKNSLESLFKTHGNYCDITEYVNNLKNTQMTLGMLLREETQHLDRFKQEVFENETILKEVSEFIDRTENENTSKLIADSSLDLSNVDDVINDLKSSAESKESLITSTAIVEELLNRSLPKLL